MDNKQLNKDWTIREDRTPRKKDVVIDTNFLLGVVTKSEGDFGKKKIWVEDSAGNEMYTAEPVISFKIANREQTSSFYLEYKKNTGWLKGRIYNVKDRDYPLQLVEMTYDLVKQEMLYLFRDLNTPDLKHLKTNNESVVEKIPEEMYDLLSVAFSSEESLLKNRISVNIEEIDSSSGWSVVGNEFSFSDRDAAEMEIQKWKSRLKIRRISSLLSLTRKTSPSMVCMSDDGFLFITDAPQICGQPAIFNSRVDAALSIYTLGEATWASALYLDSDKYDI